MSIQKVKIVRNPVAVIWIVIGCAVATFVLAPKNRTAPIDKPPISAGLYDGVEPRYLGRVALTEGVISIQSLTKAQGSAVDAALDHLKVAMVAGEARNQWFLAERAARKASFLAESQWNLAQISRPKTQWLNVAIELMAEAVRFSKASGSLPQRVENLERYKLLLAERGQTEDLSLIELLEASIESLNPDLEEVSP